MKKAGFESWRDYQTFSHYVRRKARHVLNAESQRFLESVLKTSEKRKATIEKDGLLWRAQLAFDWRTEKITDDNGVELDSVEVPCPADTARMVPLPDRATEGRVNAKGIPCLYLSTNRGTAMTEVRPWIGSYVSVAEFVVLRDLTVVDCSAGSSSIVLHLSREEPPPEKREEYVWRDINRAFSEPVDRSDDVADYAPTQVLADAFRARGFDGIVYGSKLGDGKNVAFFDVGAADLMNCDLYEVKSIEPEFSHAANPYFIRKYYRWLQMSPQRIRRTKRKRFR